MKYKLKEIKTFVSDDWMVNGMKRYRKVFDQSETAYVYVEVALHNLKFTKEDWDAKVQLQVSKWGKNSEILGDIPIEQTVTKDEPVVYIRHGWGTDTKGNYWEEGKYIWRAFVNGKKVGSATFYVYDIGEISKDDNPWLEVMSVKLYEGSEVNFGVDNRDYLAEFNGEQTRYVWAEFRAKNTSGRDWHCEIAFTFYTDTFEIKGRATELQRISKTQKTLHISSGWGSSSPGTWTPGMYFMTVTFMDTLLGIVPFKVGDEKIQGDLPFLEPEIETLMELATVETPKKEEVPLENILEPLDKLIGLKEVKERIKDFTYYVEYLSYVKARGLRPTNLGVNLHSVFLGNPGTGKTTVAKLLGAIYKKLGLLSKGHVHTVGRIELVGEYIGQTAPKVKEAIKKARGGILFVDEAYSLFRSQADSKDFGREVIEVLVKEMSDGEKDLSIIMAGYPDEMRRFVKSNPGLLSRVGRFFTFPDYDLGELIDIAKLITRRRSMMLGFEARELLKKELEEIFFKRSRNFGNARFVEKVIEESIVQLGVRLMKTREKSSIREVELYDIKEEDMEKAFAIQYRQQQKGL